jgi:hypothetical protein
MELGFAEVAESRHSGIENANHGRWWQYFRQNATNAGVSAAE